MDMIRLEMVTVQMNMRPSLMVMGMEVPLLPINPARQRETESNEHDPDEKLKRGRQRFGNRKVQGQQHNPHTQQHQRVAESPKQSNGGGSPHRRPFCQDRRQRCEMIRVHGVTEPHWGVTGAPGPGRG